MGWINRELAITAALEEEVDNLFGEEYLTRLGCAIQRMVEIEAKEYLGMEEPNSENVGEIIHYWRSYRRLTRFRTEKVLRDLLDTTWIFAYQMNMCDPTEKEMRYVADRIKGEILLFDEFITRRELGGVYDGKKTES
jgi:hypothetical protein